MFARISIVSTFLLLILPVLAAATALPRNNPPPPPNNQCNTGTIECCKDLQAADSPVVGLLAGLLGIILGPVEGLIGINCTPITIIGGGGTSCSAQPVCCTGNSFQGLLVIGCSPININL